MSFQLIVNFISFAKIYLSGNTHDEQLLNIITVNISFPFPIQIKLCDFFQSKKSLCLFEHISWHVMPQKDFSLLMVGKYACVFHLEKGIQNQFWNYFFTIFPLKIGFRRNPEKDLYVKRCGTISNKTPI